jgi:hypothetical protein
MLRYFLIPIAMFLLSISPWLAHLWRNVRACRPALAIALGIYVIGNLWNLDSFLAIGRGQYAEALAWIANQTPGPTLTLSSDNPIRTELLVEFYGPRVVPGRPVIVTEEPQSWLILNRAERTGIPAMKYQNYLYTLERVYPSTGLSGWTWQVYRRDKAFGH